MKPDGSTRRTRPCSGSPPPHCSMITGAPGGTRTASVESRSATISSRAGSPISSSGSPARHDRLALAESLEDDAVDRGDDRDDARPAAAGACSRARASCSSYSARVDGELGGSQRLFRGSDRRLRGLEIVAGDGAGFGQLLLAPQR